jgi:PAS domain S-box-containing protein
MNRDVDLRRLHKFSEATKLILSNIGSSSLEEQLTYIARYAAEILDAETGAIFLVKQEGYLTLEASYGHREGGFEKGKLLPITSTVGGGLTGHIAAAGNLFNAHSDDLSNHPAVRGVEPGFTPSTVCSSLLAVPLKRKEGGSEKIFGLLKVCNKRSAGENHSVSAFSQEDEWILEAFAEQVAVAINSAAMVGEMAGQRDLLVRLLAASPTGIIAADREGRITEVNESARQILGYPPYDSLPNHVADIYFDENDARRVGLQLHTSPHGRLSDFITILKSRDGALIPVRLSATWLYSAGSERVGSVGYFEDLRSIKEAEKQLQLFLEASSVISETDSPQEGLQLLIEKVSSLLGNTFYRVLLLDDGGRYLHVEAAHRIERRTGEVAWAPRLGERIAVADYEGLGELLKEGRPVVIRGSDTRHRQFLDRLGSQLGLGRPVQSSLMVPLRLGVESVGLLEVGEMRCEERRPFPEDKIGLAMAAAAQMSVLLKRIKLSAVAVRRRILLERLDEKALELRSEKEISKLEHDVARLAVDLLGERWNDLASILFVNHKLSRILEPKSSYRLGLPPTEPLRYEDGPIGEAAEKGQPKLIDEYSVWAAREGVFPSPEFNTVLAVPLKHGGEVEYILALADRAGSPAFGEAEVEALERFAAQAAIALKTAEVLSPDRRKSLKHLGILHQMTNYILSEEDFEKLLNAVLTGITAGYGLGFNRAALFLLDETGEMLAGVQGIGQFEQREAEESWRNYHSEKLDTFPAYLESLKRDPVPLTPVGEWVRWYKLPVSNDRSGFFKRAVFERQWSTVTPEQLNGLPRDFFYGFKPTTEMVIVPLHAREKSVGVLVADNKFNKSLITHEDVESLMTYANTAALAIDNLRLLKRIEVGNRKMQLLFEAGTRLRTTSDPERVLLDIVELTHKAADADWVRIILIDELGRPHSLTGKGDEDEPTLGDLLRPGGISEMVMKTGEFVKIENTYRTDREFYPERGNKGPEALLCLPLAMQGRKFGVMWIGYKSPRVFHEVVINALQLYVNQAAVAYDSARRMEELEQMRQAAEALADVDDPQAVLEQIVKSARAALRADSAAIWTYDDVRDQFDPESWAASNISHELSAEFWKAQPRFGGTAHTVMRKGLISIRDVEDGDPYDFLGESTRRLLGRIGVRSFLGIALTAGDERLGVLYVNYNRPRSFTEEEQETARSFANHAAMALKRAKLLEQVWKTKKAAEAVAKVTVVGNHERTLQEIVKETTAALDCDAVVLFVFDKAKDELRHPPYMHGVKNEDEARHAEDVPRDSVVYKILNRPETEFIESADEAPLIASTRFRKEEGIMSVVGIPLRAGGEKVGVMFVNYRRHHRFTDEERANIELFANQTAVAIRNAQLFEQQQQRLREQAALLEFSRRLLGMNRLDETMQAAVDSAAEMLRVEFCALVFPDEEGSELVFSAGHGWDEKAISALRPWGVHGSQTGYTIKQRAPVVVEDFEKESRFEVHPVLREVDIRSGLSVPMFEGEDIIGAIVIHSRQRRRFSDEEVDLLSLIANQTAVAMHSARQFEEVSRRQRNLDALYQASKAITASFRPDPERVLSDQQKVLDEITRQAVTSITGQKPTLGTIQLYDEATDEVVFKSVYPPGKYAELVAKHGERNSLLKDGRPWDVVAEAMRTGQPQLIDDVRQCPHYVEYDPDTLSELAVPLVIEGKVRGALNVESNKAAAFDKDDVTNLQALAELAVVALNNAELYDELKELDRKKTEFLSAISHELRTPLTPAQGYIENMLDGIYEPLTERQRTELKKVEGYVGQEIQLIENLLDVARIQEYRVKLEQTCESMSELISEVVGVYKNRAGSGDVVLTEELPEADPLEVLADAGKIKQVLTNLLANAFKFTRKGTITVGAERRDSEVMVRVRDTGIGIPAEHVPKVFDRFYQVDSSIRREARGVGIGLNIAREYVELHGGCIGVLSVLGEGSEFWFTLPCLNWEGGGSGE